MKILTRALLPFIVFLLCLRLEAQKIEAETYEIQAGDSLLSIAENYLAPRKRRYENVREYMKDLRAWNPHIQDFDRLEAGVKLNLDFPFSPFLGQ